ncbi:TRAP transporter large permease [Bacillus tuaregi]|uniref:TRAP transporter large permease n=1 Tax=Bacillus tuaregi TaxID=1816695 RepID=UPI0008F83DD6|nr:TRAP transporter large permease subunit [Bacillus tuaregi]
MEWWLVLIIILFSLLTLMFMRVPVAFAFILVNIGGALVFWGMEGMDQLVMSIKDSLVNFSLIPIPLFVLMGEIMFHAGLAGNLINTIDKWFGKVPGRLSLIAVGGGTALSTLTGSSASTTAILGSTLLPEMEKKGYKNELALGPILGSGGLAVLIPPSALGVLLASVSKVSIGTFMVAIILPGVLVAILFALYVIIRARTQPHLAPVYSTEKISLKEKMVDTIKYVLPLGFILFLVIGLILLGISSPTESAALGAFGSLVLAAAYRKLTKESLINAFKGTMKISVMILMIVTGSTAFSQILAFSGATQEMVRLIAGLSIDPIVLLSLMLFVIIIMGTFMEGLAIIMIVLPIFTPVAMTLGFDLYWFSTLVLIAVEVGAISPPFGLGLFVLKSVSKYKMSAIYKSSIPFVALFLIALALLIAFPEITLWLPSLMKT